MKPLALILAAAAGAAGAVGVVVLAKRYHIKKVTYVDVYLEDIGDNELMVIRAIRTLTDLSLVDIRERIEGSPESPLLTTSLQDAQKVLRTLTEVGATVELRV